MSIAVLTQVYDEMRRLAIAGSVTAGGDFRLKKLIPSLEQAGAKAPVFAKIAQAVKTLVEATEQTSASALLELSTLVNAVLYTQGETGISGDLADIETNDLGPQTSQVSASVLKPLLEALTTTGSGRLEIIKESFERGAFRDVRLVKPALHAIDDTYAEIADFVAKKVLSLYGKAILPDLKSSLDVKSGKGGHLLRLALMHQLDPPGTREIVKHALENGSKDIKIAAIECLGDAPDDLNFLLEQSSARTKDVRRAALNALAKSDSEAVVETLRKAMMGGDLDIAVLPIRHSRSPNLLQSVIDAAGKHLEALFKTKNTSKEKNEVGKGVERLLLLLSCLEGRVDEPAEEFLSKLFHSSKEIQGLKGDPDGAAINVRVATLMGQGSKTIQKLLVDAHATLAPEILGIAFEAAHKSMKTAKLFDTFSPYLRAKVDEKKMQRDPAWAKRAAIIAGIMVATKAAHGSNQLNKSEEDAAWDHRWLDAAIAIGSRELACRLARSTHEECKTFLSKRLAAAMRGSSVAFGMNAEAIDILQSMIRIGHADAVPNLIKDIKKIDAHKLGYYSLWTWTMIRALPKSAVAPLEALLPTLRDETADQLLRCLIELKKKP
jgi:hypothetical protein